MTPAGRGRKALEGVNIRKVLEESSLPIEIATAIADRCEYVNGDSKDAARYRWLRGHGGDAIYVPAPGYQPTFLIAQGDKLDAAVDEAMLRDISESERKP